MKGYKPEGFLLTDRTNYEYTSTMAGLERAMQDGAILEGVALLCDKSYNLHVELGGGIHAIIPREEVQYTAEGEQIKDIAILTRVGKAVCFKVSGIGSSGTVMLSRRAAQRQCKEDYISTLMPGDIIPARVTHLESFGAFVDVGCGITSLLTIDSISVSRIDHPSARLGVGDTLYTVVKALDERGRIYVSQKELLGSWEENAARFSEGQTVRGIVRSVESYGIFVELRPNLAGLAEYRDDCTPGQTAAVYIKSIIPEKMKIKLIIIDSQDGPALKEPPEYFIDTESVAHLDRWRYSPSGASRVLETVFV